MAFDVFISYSNQDKTTADATCAALESAGIRCWIAPRDVRPGTEYAAAIIKAIDSCRVMVLVFSSHSNASPQVHREIECGVNRGATIIPLRIANITPTEGMEYFLGQIQWLDALTPPLSAHLVRLVDSVKSIVRPSTSPTLSLPEKPSIAVLPFQNMSGDSEQEYFCDGMVDEIITALSRFKELFVIARNSTFVWKGRAVDIREVAATLGVRYVLEGSVRKGANQLRISAQLIDAQTGIHLWADRFDGEVGNVFQLQDQVTENVIGAISPTLRQIEIERAHRKLPANLEAYDYLLRALPLVFANTPVEAAEAIRLLSQALQLDQNYAYAHGLMAACSAIIFRTAIGEQREQSHRLGTDHAAKAVTLGRGDSAALTWAGVGLLIVVQDVAGARAVLDQAVALNPNSATALAFRSLALAIIGETKAATDDAKKALRLNPIDPLNHVPFVALTIVNINRDDYSAAVPLAKKVMETNPRFPLGYFWLIVAEGARGNYEEAYAAFERLSQIIPSLRQTGDLLKVFNYFPQPLQERIAGALRKIGFVGSSIGSI